MKPTKGKQLGLDYYQRLRWNIIAFMLLVVLIPLPLVAGTIYNYYRTYVRTTVINNLKSIAEKRREAIEVFLAERVLYLKTLTQALPLGELDKRNELETVFSIVKPLSGSFVDMGLLDERGVQFAYVGPYDLLQKDYRATLWFQEVSRQGVYISDVFLGYRNVPHLAIAVKSYTGSTPWYLRVTINTDTFERLLQSGQRGALRDAYIVNRHKEILVHAGTREAIDPSSIAFPQPEEIRVGNVRTLNGHSLLTASTWLNNDRWLLLVAEDPTSEFVTLAHARQVALYLFFTAFLMVGGLTYYAARWIVRKIQAADTERDIVREHLMQTSKLTSLGKMAAGLAHEINNPLAIISEAAGYAKEILDHNWSEEADLSGEQQCELHTALEDILKEVYRGKDITQRLLGFARKMDPKIVEVDLNKTLADLIKFYGRLATKSRKVTIIQRFDRNIPVIRTDPDQIQQVVSNLVDNAVYFTSPKGGEITVATQLADGFVLLSVADNGPGMKPNLRAKIFDPFFTTKPVGDGTGLGLAICYGIVQKLGGEITVESEEGKGSKFIIRLPLEPTEDEEERHEAKSNDRG
ncbi:MAG: ATP-binding protein [Thermodesulfobacteriota bacterium]